MSSDLRSFSSQRHFQLKIDVDVKKSKGRPLFQAFGKTIYEAEWIAKPGPPIFLVKIHGARATREAAFYVQLSCHPHIVRTYGLVESDAVNVLLVQERALEGDLAERLRENEFQPTQMVLLDIFLQITEAMICLADNEIVHGDLACRNVLLYQFDNQQPEKNTVKLTDFGLTRTSSLFSVANSTVSTTLTVIPIRYAAPEVVRDSNRPIYSEKSDVYSMGVLMWEALSRAQMSPYGAIESDEEVKQHILDGRILDKPDHCEEELWDIIRQCWHQQADNRPTFKKLKEILSGFKFKSRHPSNGMDKNIPPPEQKLTWTDVIPVNSHWNAAELGDKIRKINALRNGSSPKLVLSCEDEENIQQLCVNACEAAMLIFLKKTEDAIKYLPMLFSYYIFTLNTLAREINDLKFLEDQGTILKQMLELRCRLLEADWFSENDPSVSHMPTTKDKDNEFLNKICDSHPSVPNFQNISYGQLENDYLHQCSPKQCQILEELWIEGNNLRLLIKKYKLPLITIDWLDQCNVIDITMLTKSKMDDLIKLDLKRAQANYQVEESNFQTKQNIVHLHDQFKANIKNLYQSEVLKRTVTYDKEMDQLRAKINQALNEVTSIDETATSDKIILRQQLNQIGAPLQIDWHFSKEELDMIGELVKVIISDLSLFINDIPSSDTTKYTTDEDFIASVSEGKALCGMCFLEPDRETKIPLLLPPTFVSIDAPTVSPFIRECSFSNIDDSSKFIKTIKTCGISTAFKMQGDSIELSYGITNDCNTSSMSNVAEELSRQTKSLIKVRCYVVPMRSFRIGREQMKLSPEAKNALNLVTDPTTARTFLADFGSHISDGIQRIGGIFIHQLYAKTIEEMSDENFKRLVVDEWAAGHQLSYRTYRPDISSSSEVAPNQASDKSENKPLLTMKHSLQSIGPAYENLDLFQKMLSSNMKNCLLIDRGEASSFIPVWEIIDQLYPEDRLMHDITDILKRTWLTDASDCSPSDWLLCEIDRIRLLPPTTIEYLQDSAIRPEKNPLPVSDLVSQLKEQLTEYIVSMNINYDTILDDTLLNKVKYVIQTIIRASHQNGSDLLLILVCESPVKDFLHSIGSCGNNQTFHEVQGYLSTVFSKRRLKYFHKRKIKLDPIFLTFLGQEISTAVKLDEQTLYLKQIDECTNTPTVSLLALSSHLKRTSENSAGIPCFSSHITLLVKKCLMAAQKQSRSDIHQSNLDAARRVLVRFGWSLTSEEFSRPLDGNGIVALCQELDEILSDPLVPPASDSTTDPERKVDVDSIISNERSSKRICKYQYWDWAVDRPLASTDLPTKRLIDILRHRLDIKLFSPATNSAQTTCGKKIISLGSLKKSASQKTSSIGNGAVAAQPSPVQSTVYDALIQLVEDSHVLSQVELFRLLLERRSLIPLLTPNKLNRHFMYHVKPLTFVDVKLSLGNYCNMSTDTTLFRVVFLSMRSVKESESREFLKQVFGCNSLISSSVGELGSVAEVGVGFCPKIDNDADSDKSSSEYNEVLVLHVIGDYAPIFPYIHDFADLFIVESHAESSIPYQPPIPVGEFQKVIVWKSTAVAKDPFVSEEDFICLESTIAQAIDQIHEFIQQLGQESDQPPRTSIQDMQYPELYDNDTINWIDVEKEVKKQDYFKLRTNELQLQQLFVKEAEHLRCKIEAQTTFGERETADRNMRLCQKRRSELASDVYKHPLLKCFEGILLQSDEHVRTVGIYQFIRHLESYSKEALQDLFRKQQKAHDEFNSNSQNREKRVAYYEAKRIYAASLVTIEHLWREFAHIYVSNPKRYTHLPTLAAQHLLDGFSLELLDGDAGMLEQSWITAVFHELNRILSENADDSREKKPVRILVVSVMGVQSSGKSTLLNLMFGTRLRASAGMCTRGVNMQLLKAENRPEYDYVLILDTEGVRAPEFSGLEGATWRDNRLATFSILPADVTIIMINNEEDTVAREILPIVMLAYQQSEIAAKTTNQLKSKLFFVYTRIDTSERDKLIRIAQSLSLELKKAAADLEQSQRPIVKEPTSEDQVLTSELLHDFHTEDIQFLGKLKVRDRPPEDIPEFDYGSDIVKLNAYIYDRLTKSSPTWRPRELSNFTDYLNIIWQCVQTVDFTLSFRTVLERWAYEDLQGYSREMYGKLSSLFSTEYEKVETSILKTLDDPSLTTADCEKMIDKFTETFLGSVQEKADNLGQEFISHLNQQKHWQSWNVDAKRGWQIFAEKQTLDVTFRIRQLITSRLLFDQEFIRYQKALRTKISDSFGKKSIEERQNIANDLDGQSQEFENIFQGILHSVNKQYPVINVEDQVHQVYDLNRIGKDFDFTAHYREVKTGKATKKDNSESNFVSLLWRNVRQTFVKSSAKNSEEEEKFLLELQTHMKNLLTPVKRYVDQVSTEAIRIIQKKLVEFKIKRDELKRKVHQVTYTQLVIQLTSIQKEWEQKHSIAARLNKARGSMWEYYQNTVKGIHGIHLLKAELVSVIQKHLKDGFLTLLEQRVITDLTHETWIGNDQILQAMLNLELITLIDNGKIEKVIRLLSNMGEHYSNKIEELLRGKIEELAPNCWYDYRDALRRDIQEAVSEMLRYRNPTCDTGETEKQLIDRGRTEYFLRTLSRRFLDHRLWRFSNDLNGLLVDSLSVCDLEQEKEWREVETEIIKTIPSKFNNDYFESADVDALIKSIRDSLANRYARGGVTLRCSEPCPLCGSPCRAAAGHTMDPAEDKRRHDADHQPSGLFGTYQFETGELVPDSCSTNMLRNYTFAYSSAQDQRLYSEFSIHFPEWKQPPSLTTNANEVGQYVFYHHQNELAKYHKCRPCVKIPASFDRDLDELKNKQEKIMKGIRF